MKTATIVILLLVAVALVAACGAPAPVVPAPTAAPTQAPTQAAPTEAAQAQPTASARTFGDAWESVACDTLGVAPELTAVAECGTITVPENRATGSDKTIQLAVVRVPSTSDNPGAPVILGTGGPGGAGLQGATAVGGGSTFTQTHATILADRDWVFFTQRGSPQAQPELSCPAYNNVPLEAAVNGWTAEEKLARAKETMQACLDDFAAQGVDLTAYNSVENAADIDALRQALGYDKIIYYGESYGTLLGQYLLRAHPEILDAIILDGIAPATATRWTDVTRIAESFQRVFDACAADDACHAAYPDPEGALAQALADLKANPAPYTLTAGEGITVPLKVDDVLAMNALFINLYIPGGYAKVPAIVYQLSQGDYSALAATIPQYFANSGIARVMHMAIACSDDPIASLDEVNLDVPEMYKGLILDDAQGYATVCPMIGVPHMPDSSDALVESDIPALLLQGGLDPATPVSGGNNVATGLPNSYNIVVPAGSHIQSHDPCVIDIMANFMNDPAAKPDMSCIDQTVAFQTPVAVSFTGPGASSAISITLPPTFQFAAAGQWSNGATNVILSSFPSTKTVEAVLGETAAALKVQDLETTPGPTIAGMESMFFQTPTYDIYVFGDEQGTYRVIFAALDANSVDFAREKIYPELLKSVTVGPAASAASAPSEATATVKPTNIPRLRELDFSPFEKDLAAFTPERAAQLDAIVKDADIAQVQDAVKAGQLSYAELTLYFLSRIKQYDDTLRTMIELNPDALKEAQAADQLLKDGKATGLMLGIPVTLKDNIETAAPMHTTGGAEILLNNQPKADASFVKQLRDAGAVILGKANLSELAGGVSSQAGFSAVGGQVVNPHGNYSPAGSSAGSGAGTAAYETMVSVGSETSGSLIAPASWNGVVGMYPGRGVVDGANVIPLVKNNDSAGPMGRSVKDVAALLAVIDTKDTDYVAGLGAKALNGVNAAFLKSDVLAQKPSALEDNSDNAAVAQLVEKGLTQAGAKVTAIELTPAGIGQQVNTLLGGMLMGGVRHDMVSYLVDAGTPVKTLEDLAAYNLAEPETRIPTGQGTIDTSLPITQLMGLKDYQEFVTQGKELATAVLDAAFADNKADVLVSVTNYHSPLYATANYPAISVPLGKRKNGMPVGVTLIGKPGSEAKLLSYAYALEQATKLRVDPDLSKVAAVSADASAAATSKFSPAWKSVSCDTFNLIKDIAEASDCGYVTVPVRHDNPDGPTIQLGVVRIRSIAEKPASDPVLFEQGGPGGSTIGFFASAGQIAKMLEFLKARDVVLVEERGTQYSVPFLDCAQPLEQAIAIAKGQAEDDGSYVNDCKARWDKQGIDLSAFNDTENAADMYSVVDALGYDQFNYYGVSYGTELGQFVMKAATDHPGVLRSVILDSVVPIDVQDEPIKDLTASQSLRTMFANCAKDAECNKNFPDLEKKTLALLDKLDATPVVVTGTLASGEKVPMSVKGEDLFTLIFESSYNPTQISHLPGILDTMIQKNDFSWIAKQKAAELAPDPSMAGGMHLAMKCPRIERQPLVPTELFDPAYPQANIAKPALADYARRCKIVNVTSAGPDDFTYPTEDIPTLILSGALDPATPPQFGEHVASNLETAYAYTLPDAAHAVVWTSPTTCPVSMAAAFLADPSKAPDASCIKGLKPVFAPRVVPLDEMKFEERTVINGVTAKIPTVFTDPQGTGLYSDPADPINAPTGFISVAVVEADTPDAALANLLKDATVIAEDQQIGNYRWNIVESRAVLKGVLTRIAVAKLPDGKHFLKVIVGGPQDNADAILATLWEPVLGSIKAQ